MNVKCKACGKRYDYHEHGCCPECGAYNRPPQRNRVGVDGIVHHISDEDFFGNSSARRKSQGGKVCFEREDCYEEQARKVRRESPFDTPVTRTEKKKRKTGPEVKRNPARVIAGIIIAIMVANIVPAFFAVHSVGSVIGSFVEDLFDGNAQAEPPISTVPADPIAEYVTVGEMFLWWDEWTAVYELSVDEQEGYTALQFMVETPVEDDMPLVCYYLPDGSEVYASCDMVTLLEDELWLFEYTLTDREMGSDFVAVFSGESERQWRDTNVLLSEDLYAVDWLPEDESLDPVTYVQVGESFDWFDIGACVEEVSVHQVGKYTDVNLTMFQAGGYSEPILRYIEDGNERDIVSESVTQLNGGRYHYDYRLADRQEESAVYLVCGGEQDGEWVETRILLAGTPEAVSGRVGESITIGDTELTVLDVQYEESGTSTTIKLSVQRDDGFFGSMPILYCYTTNGNEKMVESNSYWSKDNVADYQFKVKKLDHSAPICVEFSDWVSGEVVQIVLNG